jgi:hypothetical protein
LIQNWIITGTDLEAKGPNILSKTTERGQALKFPEQKEILDLKNLDYHYWNSQCSPQQTHQPEYSSERVYIAEQ